MDLMLFAICYLRSINSDGNRKRIVLGIASLTLQMITIESVRQSGHRPSLAALAFKLQVVAMF